MRGQNWYQTGGSTVQTPATVVISSTNEGLCKHSIALQHSRHYNRVMCIVFAIPF